jgi:hypothetical protein
METLYREMADATAGKLPAGPLLAVRSLMPYRAGRPYRAIPVGELPLVMEYARSQGAVGLYLEGDYDLGRRPHLEILAGSIPAPGLRLVHACPSPMGGEARLFAVESGSP